MKYIINLEPKVSATKEEKKEYCHIISTKDATITRIYNSSGIAIKNPNESVKKNDILISGEITLNEETKAYTCATGIVYGTTWYLINIEVPKTKEELIPTTKKRYNLMFKYNNKKKILFKTPFSNYLTKEHRIINIFGFEIYLNTDIKAEIENKIYTEEELNKMIDSLIEEKLHQNLKGQSSIKSKKVLKKVNKDSTIYIDMFIVAEEEISTQIIANIPNKVE